MKSNLLWLAGALIVAFVLAVISTTPPYPASSPANPGEPGASRAFAHIERIAAAPHPTGSAENARVRIYLVAQLQEMGFEVSTARGMLDQRAQAKLDHWSRINSEDATEFVNVIGVLPGEDRSLPAVALMAHYDSVWGSPGAPDDATGVAVILETVRAIAEQGGITRDIIVILTDAEELGLNGARQFFASNPLANRIGAIINLEARGGGGIASMFQTSAGNAEVARLYAQTVSEPSTSSLSAFLYSVLPNDTDLSPALERGGYVAYNLAFIGRSGLYHSPLATPANLDRGSLQHMLGQTHELTLALTNAGRLPAESSDAIFFDVFGLLVIVFAPWIGWLMLVIGAVGFGFAYWKRASNEGNIVIGIVRMLMTLIIGGLAFFLLNWLSGAGTGAGYYDRLAAIPKLTWMIGIAGLAVIFVLWGGRNAGLATRVGAAIPLFSLGVIGQIFAPTAAYFVVIPVMLAGLVEVARCARQKAVGLIVAFAVAALVTGYLLSLGFQIMQGVGPSMPWVAILPASLALLVWLPLWHAIPRHGLVAIVCAVGAIAMALWIRFDPVPPTVAVYSPLKPG